MTGNKINGPKPAWQTKKARDLRRHESDAERNLWARLRDGGLEGIKFRRQQPVGKYFVDFLSHSEMLIVEVDGGHHNDPTQAEKDEERSRFLRARGYRVVRFWDNEVLRNIEGVLQMIVGAINEGEVGK